LPATARAGVPPVRAAAYLVEDARTGEVLASSNAHAERPIASLTKLMTVLLTLQHHKLTDVVTVDPRAAAVGESSIELDSGEQMTVKDLLKGTLIQSANDAADALALSIAPDYPSFARLMNAEAVKLGLHHTHFVRPDGLDAPGEYSSAKRPRRSRAGARCTPGTTCCRSSRRRSASRRVIRTSQAGARSRRRAVVA
jgi:D-alanyl-D-alanine carboxypeptidase